MRGDIGAGAGEGGAWVREARRRRQRLGDDGGRGEERRQQTNKYNMTHVRIIVSMFIII